MKMPRLQWSKELRELQEEWVQKGGPELRSRRTGNANKLLFIFTSVGVAAAAHKYKKKIRKNTKYIHHDGSKSKCKSPVIVVVVGNLSLKSAPDFAYISVSILFFFVCGLFPLLVIRYALKQPTQPRTGEQNLHTGENIE